MSRQSIIDKAKSQVGVKENPAGSNNTEYGVWYGINHQPWCAIFVSWVYDQAGHPLGKINGPNGYASCQDGFNHWKASGELTNNPQPGDIVLFDWTGDGHCDHTGIFVSWIEEGKTLNTIEGNTSEGNDSDGGAVMPRKRKRGSVKAFVSPKVLGAETGNTAVSDDLALGSEGSAVAQLQKELFNKGYAVVVDGDFGPKTEAALKQYQKDNNLPETGISIDGRLPQPLVENTGAILRQGNSGASVVTLQKALIAAGSHLSADGVFGTGTFAEVVKFQQKNGLKADGIAGPKTLAALGITII